MKFRSITIVCLILLVLPVFAQPDQFERVRAAIREQMQKRSVPSVSVAVARDGKIIWEEAFGWADRENRIEATPHTSTRSLRFQSRSQQLR